MTDSTLSLAYPHPRLPDPDVKPPEYRVPRGRSGTGSKSALDQLLSDLERIRRAKAYYGELPQRRIDLV
jgi:hypothetical protein